MNVLVDRRGAVTVLALRGEVDAGTVSRLRRAVAAEVEAGARQLVVDLTDVGFMDSTALAALLGLQNDMRLDHGGDLRLCGPPPQLRQVLALTRLEDVFAIFPHRAAAVASYL